MQMAHYCGPFIAPEARYLCSRSIQVIYTELRRSEICVDHQRPVMFHSISHMSLLRSSCEPGDLIPYKDPAPLALKSVVLKLCISGSLRLLSCHFKIYWYDCAQSVFFFFNRPYQHLKGSAAFAGFCI